MSKAISKVTKQKVLTEDEFIQAMPKKFKGRVTPQVMKHVNTVLMDETEKEAFKDNLISYSGVLSEGKFKLETFIAAVKYVSFKTFGLSNREAYSRAMPDKMAKLKSEGATVNKIDAYVHQFNASKIVNLIWAQTLTPVHILNAGSLQKAINKLVQLMDSADSEKVQCDAALGLMKELKPPENAVVELNINNKADSQIEALKEITARLAAKHIESIQGKSTTLEDVAQSSICLEATEVEDVT